METRSFLSLETFLYIYSEGTYMLSLFPQTLYALSLLYRLILRLLIGSYVKRA